MEQSSGKKLAPSSLTGGSTKVEILIIASPSV